jgi:hypothetical protein
MNRSMKFLTRGVAVALVCLFVDPGPALASANSGVRPTQTKIKRRYVKPVPVKDLLGVDDVEPLGQSATVSMTTKRPATITIEIGAELQTAPNGFITWTDNGSGQSNMTARAVSPGAARKYAAKFTRLIPHRRYYALITAREENGQYQQFSGSFNTKTRHMRLNLQSLYMNDDSDSMGSCECYFTFGWDGRYRSKFEGDFSSDDSYFLHFWNDVNYQKSAPLNFKVYGLDDDDDWLDCDYFPACGLTLGQGWTEPTYDERGTGEVGGDGDLADWSAVWGELDLNPDPDGNENIEGEFTLGTSVFGSLKYEVKFYYDVWYE